VEIPRESIPSSFETKIFKMLLSVLS